MRNAGGLLVAAALCLGGVAEAQVPRVISFQGRLALKSGAAAANNSYNLTFKVYTTLTGGTACHTETRSVPITNGVFRVGVGSLDTACTFAAPSYLEVTVNTETMAPRIPLVATPYAITAGALARAGSLVVVGSGAGQVPRNNGVLSTGLNADKVDGKHAAEYAPAVHAAHPSSGVPVYVCSYPSSPPGGGPRMRLVGSCNLLDCRTDQGWSCWQTGFWHP